MSATKKSFPVVGNFLNKVESDQFAKVIYGNAIHAEDSTIVPIAKVKYGFGFGLGDKLSQTGEGGGAGISATPIGYIEMHKGKTRFKKIRPAASLLSATLSVAVTGLFLFHVAKKLIVK